MALPGTKLHVPRPRRQLAPRSRLVDQLLEEADPLPRLVLVCASAGFGKTTLLSQWLTRWQTAQPAGSRRVAWLSLDAEDSDPRRFLTNVVAAVQAAEPRIGVDAAALLQTDGAAVAPGVVVSLVNDLDSLDGPFALALDDYHVVESQEVHDVMTFLLDHLPAGAGVAIITRADPPLPVARLRARGELLELRATDLRFTQREAAAFLNDVMGLALEPEHVDALESRTEGRAAGLQLAALSLRNRSDAGTFIEAFAGSHRFVLDYLVEEVLNGESEQTRASRERRPRGQRRRDPDALRTRAPSRGRPRQGHDTTRPGTGDGRDLDVAMARLRQAHSDLDAYQRCRFSATREDDAPHDADLQRR